MLSNYTQYLGILGNILLVISYLPQIKKIIVTRKSEDLSTLMWLIILLGDGCMLAYAVIKNDTIFAILFTIFIIENLVVLYLTIKFKPKPEDISPRTNLGEQKGKIVINASVEDMPENQKKENLSEEDLPVPSEEKKP